MTSRFDYFVVFAEMRTGSNFLEANLNQLTGVRCHGEAFNPYFIGYPKRTEILGMSLAARDANPQALIMRIKAEPGCLSGFRFFHDHDPRVIETILDDARCAKIILTRNPVDSYVSWKIAQATDQWKLTNIAKQKSARARFQAPEFDAHVAGLQEFQLRLLRGLQRRGQTGFYIGYDDLNDLDVLNGLAAWLGVDARLESLDGKMKRQNPQPLAEKVENYPEMERALARFDRFDLTRTPNFEPRRGPVVPGYIAAARAPAMYLPIRSGPEDATRGWLAALDGTTKDELHGDFTQKTLRQWMRRNPGHRRFTILRHPVARAHAAFCDKILATGPGSYLQLRRKLINRHGIALPDRPDDPGYDATAHRAAFKGFLEFVRQNLNGQTNLRIDGHWCTQTAIIQGMADFALPDILIREAEAPDALARLAVQIGRDNAQVYCDQTQRQPYSLDEIYDVEIEEKARAAYQRDYLCFGFGNWA